jgi:hypothetical protein
MVPSLDGLEPLPNTAIEPEGTIMLSVFEQIFCAIVGGIFIWLAFTFIQKKHLPYAFVATLIGAGFLLCTLSGVQSLIKSGILWRFTQKLTSYGEKMDGFQISMNQMRDDISEQQAKLSTNQLQLAAVQDKIQKALSDISTQQSSITNQFQRILTLQNEVVSAQTNLTAQQKQLEDVEYWVQHLYDKMADETFPASDTNHVLMVPLPNGSITFFLRASHVPIRGSFENFVLPSAGREQRMDEGGFIKNIVMRNLVGGDTNTLSFRLHYVIDTRETNFYKTFPQLNTGIWIINDKTWGITNLPN